VFRRGYESEVDTLTGQCRRRNRESRSMCSGAFKEARSWSFERKSVDAPPSTGSDLAALRREPESNHVRITSRTLFGGGLRAQISL
jgi:hypothetical protein